MNLSLKHYWALLAQHIRPQRWRFALLAVLLLGSIALQVVNPQIMRFFIDTAMNGGQLALLTQAAAAFIGIALFQQVVSVSVAYLSENVAWTATNALRAELAWHCLNLDMGFHNTHTPGELIERIDGDVTEMALFFSQFVVTLLGNLLLLIGILIALFREDWRAGLAFTVFATGSLLALNAVRGLAMRYEKGRRQAEAELMGFIEEQLNGTEDIRSSGAVDFSLRELTRLQGGVMQQGLKARKKEWIINNVVGGTVAVGTMLALGAGYGLFSAGLATVGTVYLFIHYLNLLESPIWTLAHQIETFQTIGACVERLTELRNIQPKVQAPEAHQTAEGSLAAPESALALPESSLAAPEGPLALAFDHVDFSYNDEDTVLSGLTFQIQPGRVLGLLGRTGSGKTTLTRLVFRLYDPSAGCIYLNGQAVQGAQLQALRRRIGIVTQEVQLFRASVRDNLTFFDRDIPDERILEVFHELELDDWYRRLPDGLDSLLESGGHSLSAGQAQLLAFARIFLRNPGLVILDEASSRLDPATEQHIERAIDKLLHNRTAIIVAHRLGTVQRAHEIMILENGQIREYGGREQLARDPESQFHHLLKTGLEEVLV